MNKVLVDRELLERIANKASFLHDTREDQDKLAAILAQPEESEEVENSKLEKLKDFAKGACSYSEEDWFDQENLWSCMERDDASDFVSYVDALRAECERYKSAFNEWYYKTEWVQETATAKELGMHRADVLRERIESLQAECERLEEELQNATQSSGAEAYEIACEEMESYQRERVKLGKNAGTQLSLVDGMASIFEMLDNAESECERLRAEYATELDAVSQRNYNLRFELAAIKDWEREAVKALLSCTWALVHDRSCQRGVVDPCRCRDCSLTRAGYVIATVNK